MFPTRPAATTSGGLRGAVIATENFRVPGPETTRWTSHRNMGCFLCEPCWINQQNIDTNMEPSKNNLILSMQ